MICFVGTEDLERHCRRILSRVPRLAVFLFSAATLVGAANIADVRAETKTLTVVDSFDIKDWDPAVFYSEETRVLLNIYETLVFYNSNTGDLEPRLATDWSVSEDGLVWTFNLREGVKFHDGEPLNSVAVKASFERTIKLGLSASVNWSNIESIQTPADLTVVFKTKVPIAADLIASAQYASLIYSPKAAEHDTDWFNEGNEAGTGPYVLRQWIKGQQIVLEKNPDYWRGWNEEQFDRIVVRIVDETSTQVQMLRSGEADIINTPVPPDMVASLQTDPGITVGEFASWVNVVIPINTRKYPTDNLKFRKALTHIMNGESLVRDIYAGYATVAVGPVPSTLWGHPEFDMPKFDLTLARKLLEESGVPEDEWKISWAVYAGEEPIRNMALMFQQHAAQVGLDVDIRTGEWGVMWDKQRSLESSSNVFPARSWPDYATPLSWLFLNFHTEDPVVFNWSYYSDPDVDRLMAEAASAEGSDRAKTAELAAQAYHKAIIEDIAAIFPADLLTIIAHRSNLSGVVISPAYLGVFWYDVRRTAG